LKIPIPSDKWHRVFLICAHARDSALLDRQFSLFISLLQRGDAQLTSSVLTTSVVAFGRVSSASAAEKVLRQLLFEFGGRPTLHLLRLLYRAYDQLLSRSEHLHFFYIIQAAFPDRGAPVTSTTSDHELLSNMIDVMSTARTRAEEAVSGTRQVSFWTTVGRFNIPVFDDAPTEYLVNELARKGRVGKAALLNIEEEDDL
jgi:hypothetical protein